MIKNLLNINRTEVPHQYKMSALYSFFCWCSGARLYLLKACPTDYNKFFGIGIIIFLTGVMASTTGYYALFIIFNSVVLAAIFGIFWGVLIFFLDWYIVLSLKKEDKFLSELMLSFPRIILAVLLATVISRPLELKLFEKEIESTLQEMHTKNSIKQNQLIDKEFKNIEILNLENKNLTYEIAQKEKLRNRLFNMMIEEAEGRSPTSKAGKGAVYAEKKAEYDKIDAELSELKARNNQQIKRNAEQLAELESFRLKQVAKANSKIKQSDGLLARMEAMSILAKNNTTIKYASWFILALFILIESSPILVKLLSKRGPYDELIDKEEYEKQVEYRKQKLKAKILTNNYIELLKQKDYLQTESDKRNNERLILEIEKAKDEINRLAIGNWKKEEIEALTKQIKEEIKTEKDKDHKSKSDKTRNDLLIVSDGFTLEDNNVI